jgi:fructosamine-3-kinase
VSQALRAKLAARLGSPVLRMDAASGGDINQTFTIALGDGRRLFVKTHAAPPANMYPCEARGLAWLAEPRALRVPEVLLACDADEQGPACLVLERVLTGKRTSRFDEALGQGLAALHRAGAPSFGFAEPNYIALLAQDNAPLPNWGRFYAERRIAPQLRLAQHHGHLAGGLARKLETLCDRLPSLLGPEEAPARLHGDLWSGNLLCDAQGAPCLIDPAVYGGHREIDLAMMRLFGGFAERTFAAYDAAFPLAPGHAERVPLYQLYPLLVHVNLFGGQYVAQVERSIARWLA